MEHEVVLEDLVTRITGGRSGSTPTSARGELAEWLELHERHDLGGRELWESRWADRGDPVSLDSFQPAVIEPYTDVDDRARRLAAFFAGATPIAYETGALLACTTTSVEGPAAVHRFRTRRGIFLAQIEEDPQRPARRQLEHGGVPRAPADRQQPHPELEVEVEA
ncbi:MAG: hypothetical protein HYY06_33345, partial [Deltaproteobacteria bacterium]|nr:hypothetical protein [Deltaproteobacteria bacterium]